MTRVAECDVVCRNALRKGIDPRRLKPVGLFVDFAPARGQNNEVGPPVVRVRTELDEPLLLEFIDDALHALPMKPHVPGEPCDRLRSR